MQLRPEQVTRVLTTEGSDLVMYELASNSVLLLCAHDWSIALNNLVVMQEVQCK